MAAEEVGPLALSWWETAAVGAVLDAEVATMVWVEVEAAAAHQQAPPKGTLAVETTVEVVTMVVEAVAVGVVQ